MKPKVHVPGCRYEGSDQPCGQSACNDTILQEARVLLTDAYVLFSQRGDDHVLFVDKDLAKVWREKYEKIIAHIKPVGN